MTIRWTFDDPASGDSYQFEANPSAGGTPGKKKNITISPTTAWNGANVLFEGRREPREIAFSGVLLNQSMLDAMIDWWSKQHQVKLTDDLGRSYWVWISEFNPQRGRSVNPLRHKFECKTTILDWS